MTTPAHSQLLLHKRLVWNAPAYLMGTSGRLELDQDQHFKPAPTAAESAQLLRTSTGQLTEVKEDLQGAGKAMGGLRNGIKDQIKKLGMAGLLKEMRIVDQRMASAQDSSAELGKKTVEETAKKEAKNAAEDAVTQVDLRVEAAQAMIVQLITDAKRLATQKKKDDRRAKLPGKGIRKKKASSLFEEGTSSSAGDQDQKPNVSKAYLADSQARHAEATSSHEALVAVLKTLTGWDDAIIKQLSSVDEKDLAAKVRERLEKDDAEKGDIAHDVTRLKAEKKRLTEELTSISAELKGLKQKVDGEKKKKKEDGDKLKDLQTRLQALTGKLDALEEQLTLLLGLQSRMKEVSTAVAGLIAPMQVYTLQDSTIAALTKQHAVDRNTRYCDGLVELYDGILTDLKEAVKEYFTAVPVPDGFDASAAAWKAKIDQRKAAGIAVNDVRSEPTQAVSTFFGSTAQKPGGVFEDLVGEAKTLLEQFGAHLVASIQDDDIGRATIQTEIVDPNVGELDDAQRGFQQQVPTLQQAFLMDLLKAPESHPAAQGNTTLDRFDDDQKKQLQQGGLALEEACVKGAIFPVLSLVLSEADFNTMKTLAVGKNVTLTVDHVGRSAQRFEFSVQEDDGLMTYTINGEPASKALLEGQHGLVRMLQDFVAAIKAGEVQEQQWEFEVQAA